MITIITACSRPDNLPKIHQSLLDAGVKDKFSHFSWFVIFDNSILQTIEELKKTYPFLESATVVKSSASNAIGGYSHKNQAIEIVRKIFPESWLYFLDDDTVMHPRFTKLVDILDDSKSLAIFDQSFDEFRLRHTASCKDIRPGRIDMGQYCLNLKNVHDFKFDEDKYDSDGTEVQKLYKKIGESGVQIINEVFSFFNYLNPPHWLNHHDELPIELKTAILNGEMDLIRAGVFFQREVCILCTEENLAENDNLDTFPFSLKDKTPSKVFNFQVKDEEKSYELVLIGYGYYNNTFEPDGFRKFLSNKKIVILEESSFDDFTAKWNLRISE